MIRIKKRKATMDKSQFITFVIFFALLIITSVLFLYPMFWVFQNSFKTVEEYFENPNKLPNTWNLGYYVEIFKAFQVGGVGFWEMTWNSIWLTFGGQFLNILASLFVAYPLARYKFPLHKFFFGIIVFRITIPILGSSSASYKFLRSLDMINNPLFLITMFSGFDINALIMYGYFKGIDKGYSEAAYLDGATCLQVFFKIIIPQAIPCILALYIRSVMGYWNTYTTSQIYLPNYPNLALGIFSFEKDMLFIENGSAKFFGAIILSALVPVALFAVSQQTMLENMSVGGLKG